MFSWFKKKQQQPAPKVDLSHLPALNAWEVFFQGGGFNLYGRSAASVPGTQSEYIYLKSYPEVPQLERALYADWLFIAFEGEAAGVFLQRIDTDGIALIFVRFADQEFKVIKTGLTAKYSAVLTDSTTVAFSYLSESFLVDVATINHKL
jgi:hypothetical protein